MQTSMPSAPPKRLTIPATPTVRAPIVFQADLPGHRLSVNEYPCNAEQRSKIHRGRTYAPLTGAFRWCISMREACAGQALKGGAQEGSG